MLLSCMTMFHLCGALTVMHCEANGFLIMAASMHAEAVDAWSSIASYLQVLYADKD